MIEGVWNDAESSDCESEMNLKLRALRYVERS
jgi:hypothetical protein